MRYLTSCIDRSSDAIGYVSTAVHGGNGWSVARGIDQEIPKRCASRSKAEVRDRGVGRAWATVLTSPIEMVITLLPGGETKLNADPGHHHHAQDTRQSSVDWQAHRTPPPPGYDHHLFRATGHGAHAVQDKCRASRSRVLVEYAYCLVDYQCFFGEETVLNVALSEQGWRKAKADDGREGSIAVMRPIDRDPRDRSSTSTISKAAETHSIEDVLGLELYSRRRMASSCFFRCGQGMLLLLRAGSGIEGTLGAGPWRHRPGPRLFRDRRGLDLYPPGKTASPGTAPRSSRRSPGRMAAVPSIFATPPATAWSWQHRRSGVCPSPGAH